MAVIDFNNPKNIKIKFENLILEKNEIKIILETLNINSRSEEGYLLPEYTLSQHSLVGKENDHSRINAWKHELTPKQITLIEKEIGYLISHLGYDVSKVYYPYGASLKERIIDGIIELYSLPIRKARLWIKRNKFK
jgi:hypothetical protein